MRCDVRLVALSTVEHRRVERRAPRNRQRHRTERRQCRALEGPGPRRRWWPRPPPACARAPIDCAEIVSAGLPTARLPVGLRRRARSRRRTPSSGYLYCRHRSRIGLNCGREHATECAAREARPEDERRCRETAATPRAWRVLDEYALWPSSAMNLNRSGTGQQRVAVESTETACDVALPLNTSGGGTVVGLRASAVGAMDASTRQTAAEAKKQSTRATPQPSPHRTSFPES